MTWALLAVALSGALGWALWWGSKQKSRRLEDHAEDLEGKLVDMHGRLSDSENLRHEAGLQYQATIKSLRHDKVQLAKDLERLVHAAPDDPAVRDAVRERLNRLLSSQDSTDDG